MSGARSRSRSRSPRAPAREKRRFDFRLKFNQVVALKSFMEVVSSVLKETEFNVVKTDGFRGIMVQGIDSSHVALVKGRLGAETELNVPSASFCITVKNVIDVLTNAHPQHFVDFSRYEGDTDITLRIYEPGVSTTRHVFTIRTLAKEVETMEIQDIGYDYYIEAELTAIKNALKSAKSQRADSITIKICEREDRDQSAEVRNLWFILEYASDEMKGHNAFRSTVKMSVDEGPVTIVAVDGKGEQDDEEEEDVEAPMRTLYCGNFTSEFIFNFLKSMERFNVTFRLSNDKPLLLDYALGCSTSDSVRFVLAPRCADV